MNKKFLNFIMVALCAVTAFSAVACTPNGNTDDNGETGKDSVVGIYTDTWEFTKDGKVSYNPAPYDYSVKTKNGTYTVSGENVSVSWNGGGTESLKYSKGQITVDGKTHKKLDKDALYKGFANEYMTIDAVWARSNTITKLFFTENGKFTVKDGNGEYYLQAITETHGIVVTSMIDVMHIGYIAMYEPIALMYYSKIGDFYHIRMSEGSHPYTDGVEHNPWAIGHNHFVDWYVRGDSFDTVSVFNMLAGVGGTVNKPVSTTYSSIGGTTLTLFNDGVLKLPISTAENAKTFLGGKATFNNGAGDMAVTYNFIALSLTHGKIFIDMAEQPSSYNKVKNKSRFIVGDYSIDGEEITISFNYDGINYVLSK